MKDDQLETRMAELMAPLDYQLLMCRDGKDELMFACAMMQRVREIFDSQIGIENRKKMFKDLS